MVICTITVVKLGSGGQTHLFFQGIPTPRSFSRQMREWSFTQAGEMKNVAHTLPLMEPPPTNYPLRMSAFNHPCARRALATLTVSDTYSSTCHLVPTRGILFSLLLIPHSTAPVPSCLSWGNLISICLLSAFMSPFPSFPYLVIYNTPHDLATVTTEQSWDSSLLHKLPCFSSQPFLSPCLSSQFIWELCSLTKALNPISLFIYRITNCTITPLVHMLALPSFYRSNHWHKAL